MTEIQLTNVQFAQLQIDNLVAKDKPYHETWSAGDVGSFNAILNAVDFDNEFTYHMRGWSRQRVKSGTGGIITVDESNADKLYHLFTCYLSKLPSGVVKNNCKEEEYCNYCGSEELPSGIWGCKDCKPKGIGNYSGIKAFFKKGDLVIYEVTGTKGDFIDYVKSPAGHCRVDFGLCDVGLVLVKHLRHANNEESCMEVNDAS